jgi:hypothetical protein
MNKTELESRLEEAKQLYEASLYSLYKHTHMSVPPEEREEYVREKTIQIQEMHNHMINEIHKMYG